MLFTVKQFLISFKKLSTKQAQLVNIKSSWSMFYEEKKEINKQDLLNTHEALLIFQDMNTIVPWFRVKNFKTTVLRCGQRRNALIFKEADSSLTKLITKIKTKFTTYVANVCDLQVDILVAKASIYSTEVILKK